MTLYCPLTGLKIVQKKDWSNVFIATRYKTEFYIIGDSILYSRPQGFADFQSVKKYMAYADQVAEHIGDGKKPFVFIEDFGKLRGSHPDARRYYLDNIYKNDRKTWTIFCNISMPLKIAIKIGKRLLPESKHVRVKKNYHDAVHYAMTILDIEKPAVESIKYEILDGFKQGQTSLCPVKLMFKKECQISTKEYINHAVVINDHILHSWSKGYLRSKHIPVIDQMRLQCMSNIPEGASLDYIVINTKEFNAGSRRARLKYMQSLKDWHSRFPFKSYIVYNANIFMQTSLLLAKTLMPFEIRIAKDLPDVLRIIHEDDPLLETGFLNKQSKLDAPKVTPEDIDDLLGMIGNLDWEKQGLTQQYRVEKEHPFFYVYEALTLIKEELDDLIKQRQALQTQLYQSQKMESIGRLAGGVAHDFNNILQMIMGNIEFAIDETQEGTEVNKNLKEVKQVSLKGAGIVRQLLDFSRELEPQMYPVDAGQVIGDAVDFLRSTIPTNIEIKKNILDTYVSIMADPVQINQVLMNICINASQEMKITGGTIDVITDIEIIEAALKYRGALTPGPYYKIIINDTGPGIPDGIIDKIFDPYFTTKDVGKGSGLGLSVVHGIIQNHKGLISAESHEAGGTTFTILIPQVDARPENQLPMAEQSQFGNETILFIDDEKSINHLTKKGMEKLGYSVKTFMDPIHALKVFRSHHKKFDIIVTDMAMPKLNGLDLFDQLKRINPQIPIVLCTGYSDVIDKEKSEEMGFSAFVQKPFSMEMLSSKIRKVLDNQ